MAPAVVQASNHVATGVHHFHGRLGIESAERSSEGRRWADAAVEVKDRALETGAKGVDAAINRGSETFTRANSMKDRLSSEIAERARRLRRNEKEN